MVVAAAIAARYDLATTLIADAGALSLDYFHNQGSLEIASKGLQDMASQADLETERLIRDRIAEAGGGLTAGCEIIAPAPGVKQPFLDLLAAVKAAQAGRDSRAETTQLRDKLAAALELG